MRPSARLQAWIRQTIDAQPDDGSAGNWPRQVMKQHDVLLVHGDNLVLWFLGIDGVLYSLDTDTVARRLEKESDPNVVHRVLAIAARNFPELTELLG